MRLNSLVDEVLKEQVQRHPDPSQPNSTHQLPGYLDGPSGTGTCRYGAHVPRVEEAYIKAHAEAQTWNYTLKSLGKGVRTKGRELGGEIVLLLQRQGMRALVSADSNLHLASKECSKSSERTRTGEDKRWV